MRSATARPRTIGFRQRLPRECFHGKPSKYQKKRTVKATDTEGLSAREILVVECRKEKRRLAAENWKCRRERKE
jgi:hypothetical protein